jgi:hypothetical protein
MRLVRFEMKVLYLEHFARLTINLLSAVVVSKLSRCRIHRANKGVGLAYMYCDSRLQQVQTAKNIVGLVIKTLFQGMKESEEAFRTLQSYYYRRRGAVRRGVDDLIQPALDAMSAAFRGVFLVIDSPSELSREALSGLERLVAATRRKPFDRKVSFRVVVFDEPTKIPSFQLAWERIDLDTGNFEQFLTCQFRKWSIFHNIGVLDWKKRQNLLRKMETRCNRK